MPRTASRCLFLCLTALVLQAAVPLPARAAGAAEGPAPISLDEALRQLDAQNYSLAQARRGDAGLHVPRRGRFQPRPTTLSMWQQRRGPYLVRRFTKPRGGSRATAALTASGRTSGAGIPVAAFTVARSRPHFAPTSSDGRGKRGPAAEALAGRECSCARPWPGACGRGRGVARSERAS
jgi:hypothetical protein